ncbi:MAG: SDR family oxidoreductase, partial [Gemmatimonadetes bacterium]|nr:SDR family oxidoreductase [Gemmatimonadota bacterium]
VTAPFVLGQRAARRMAERGGGAIINISSVHSEHVWPNDTAYGVAKAALNRLTKSMATEWAPFDIRANAIAPGYINVSETPEEQARYDATDGGAAPWIVARRTARPTEIADVALAAEIRALLQHFQPLQPANRLARPLHRHPNRLIETVRRYAHQIDGLEDLRHDILPSTRGYDSNRGGPARKGCSSGGRGATLEGAAPGERRQRRSVPSGG